MKVKFHSMHILYPPCSKKNCPAYNDEKHSNCIMLDNRHCGLCENYIEDEKIKEKLLISPIPITEYNYHEFYNKSKGETKINV